MRSELHLIVAIANDGAIGKNGDMPWGRNLPADLKHFKETTMGHPIVMGRKTYESLPKRPLPGRTNIVVTRNSEYQAEGAVVVHNLEDALEVNGAEKLFLIGGGELYRQGIELADVLHITLVHHKWDDADTYFPSIDLDKWQCVQNDYHEPDDKNLFPYSFTQWIRKEKSKEQEILG